MKNKLLTLTLIILTSLTVIQLFSRVFNSPLDFDEGYNLQVSQNLRKFGVYQTYEGPLDVNITTGPTVLIPGALLYSPGQPLLPRLVMVAYALLFLTILITKYFRNKAEKAIYLFLINITPLFFLFSTQILGELPGFIFLFFSYLAFSRSKYFLSGVLFAFSVLTKTAFIVGILPFIVHVLFNYFDKKMPGIKLKNLLLMTAGVVISIAIGELFKLSQFGFDPAKYQANFASLLDFTQSRGGAVMNQIGRRMEMVGYTLHIGGFFFLFLSIYITFYSFLTSNRTEIKLISLYVVFSLLQFTLFGSGQLYRHLFPSVLALLLLIPYFLSSFLSSLNFDRKLFLVGVLTVLIVSGVGYLYRDPNEDFVKKLKIQNLLFLDQSNRPYIKPKKILSDQFDIARYINSNINISVKLAGKEWLNSPEISYLAQRKIYRDSDNNDVKYVLFSLYNKYLDPNTDAYIRKAKLEKIYGNDSYDLYIKPSFR